LAASFFDIRDQAISYVVLTENELEDALVAAEASGSLVLIELVLNRLDAPEALANFAPRAAEFDFPQLSRAWVRRVQRTQGLQTRVVHERYAPQRVTGVR
jgi:hypothetical protein